MSIGPESDLHTKPAALAELGGTLARGARYLVARQTIGLIVSVGGVLALTRLIGPRQYGVYAAAFGLFATWQTAVELSLDVFLVRRSGEIEKRVYDQVFMLLLVLGVGGLAIALALLPLIAHFSRLPHLSAVCSTMFALLPLIHLSQVPLSKLERELDYRHVGFTETVAQVAFFVVALPLAVLGAGVWAPVAGFWAQQLTLIVLFFAFGGYRPAWYFDPALIREALAFGFACTCATWSYSVRNLAAPIIVARLLGPAAVAFVALTGKLVEQLAFLRQVTFRMSLAVMTRIRGHRQVMQQAVADGMLVQLVIAGVPFVVFSVLGRWLVPLIFGAEWAPAAELFAITAPAFLANIAFNLHLATLMSLPRPWILLWVNGLNSALLWLGVWIFVPGLGLRGYGVAELLTVLSYVAMHRAYRRCAEPPPYRLPVLWWTALSLGVLSPVIGWWFAAAPILLVLHPSSREAAQRLSRLVGLRLRRKSQPTALEAT